MLAKYYVQIINFYDFIFKAPPNYAHEKSFSARLDIEIKFDLSVNDHILHTFSSAKFRNVKIKLTKFLNDHHIILNAFCFTKFYVHKTMEQNEIF